MGAQFWEQKEITDDLEKEVALFRTLKPYLGRCMDLNHAISNPLTGIIGFVECLLAGPEPLSNDQKEQLNQILYCAERIVKHVEDLSHEKIALAEKTDLGSVVRSYRRAASSSD